VEDLSLAGHGIPLVSFFAGCGGLDIGFEAAGFHHVAAFEFNEVFCRTLRRNRPHWNVIGPPVQSGDISDVTQTCRVLQSTLTNPFPGVFIGGPPCQPFSIAANQRFSKRGQNFKRTGFDNHISGNLLFDYLQIIIEFRPRAFLIENVTGLRDIDDGKQLNSAVESLKRNGYSVFGPEVMDASNFFVPQFRKRLFVAGILGNGSFSFPTPTNTLVPCGAFLSETPGLLPNGETREHNSESIRRYMELYYGQRDQLGRVDRLDPSIPSKTVIAGGTNGGGRSHLHPEIPRTLSVRECARLQTFPDKYVFCGPTARQFTQVGNAVPPLLAAQIARSFYDALT